MHCPLKLASELDPDEVWAEMKRLTDLSQSDWADLLSLPTPALLAALETYRHMDWCSPKTSFGQRVLELLPIVGEILGVVSGASAAKAAIQNF